MSMCVLEPGEARRGHRIPCSWSSGGSKSHSVGVRHRVQAIAESTLNCFLSTPPFPEPQSIAFSHIV